MSAIVLLDTTVYLNILDIPGLNQCRDAVFNEFEQKVANSDYFLLPLATILETGNHISRLNDGRRRMQFARKMVDDVRLAMTGEAPYRPTQFPSREDFLDWLHNFPDKAMRSKHGRRERPEGMSLSDLSIYMEWKRTCALNSMSRVLIWSLDSDLSCNEQNPNNT